MKKKLAPKTAVDPPAAKLNSKGKLVTNKEELEQLYLDTYIERLTPNPVDEDLEDIFELKNELFDMRIEESKTKVTSDWTMDDLEEILKTLKSNKARNAQGHVYELFKYGGQDLKTSLLNLAKLVKKMQIYPIGQFQASHL